MDVGRGPPFTTVVYPFADRPGVPVEVLFYHVPDTNPDLPIANPFVLRAWDVRDSEEQTPLGTDQAERIRYTGILPGAGFLPFSGTVDEWQKGADYARWLANLYTNNCQGGIPPVSVIDVKNVDGTLTVAPNTGHVVVSLNLSHVNIWLRGQGISPVNLGDVPLELQIPVGSVQAWLACRDGTGALTFVIDNSGRCIAPGGFFCDTSLNTNPLAVNIFDGADVVFGIANDGSILTNQETPGGTLDTLQGTLPIYDSTGALLGYIPYYTLTVAPTMIMQDNGNGPLGVTIDGRTPNLLDTPGTLWSVVAGSIVTTTAFQFEHQTVGNSRAVWDSTHVDSVWKATGNMTATTGADTWGLMTRYKDFNNWWGVIANSGLLLIFENASGTITTRAFVAFTPVAGTPFELTVTVAGATITGQITGGPTVSYGTMTTGLAETKLAINADCTVMNTATSAMSVVA